MENPTSIPLHVLEVLPPGKPLCIEEVWDIDDNKRMAVKWVWVETKLRSSRCRVAHFALDTGEYLEEVW
jgi:hypothetical protein